MKGDVTVETVLSQEELIEIFDQIMKEVTEKVSGIQLYEGAIPFGDKLSTVYAVFERGFQFGLSLCVDTALFIRLTQNIMEEEEVTPQDVADFSKEYFNVVCGNIASKLFQATKVGCRFNIPAFYPVRYEPEERQNRLIMRYYTDQNESAQLTYYMPVLDGQNVCDKNTPQE